MTNTPKMRTRTIDYQEHWSKCLSQIYDLTAEIRHYQSSLANSEQIIDALAQERQDLYAREHQNDQMLGAFRARYQMYKEQFDEQNEMIKGLRGDLRKAQEENRVLQGEALGRTDRCLRLAEDVGEARMERAGVLRLMEVERGKNRDAQRVLEVENERLRAELEELRGQTKG